MGLSGAQSSGLSGTIPNPRSRAARRKPAPPCRRSGWNRPASPGRRRRTWRYSQAGRDERIDGRSLAERRDAAVKAGDLERAG